MQKQLDNPVMSGEVAEQAIVEARKNRKTFGISLSNAQKKPGLVKSFLAVETISRFDRKLVTRDNVEWPVYHEPELSEAFKHNETQKCIISFQAFDDGEFFCVARLYKEGMGKKKGKQ